MATSVIKSNTVLVPRIESRIQVIRGLRVMLDVDLAALYGVQTKRLNEQVKRNRDRFPSDFLFQLTSDEKTEVVANCDHLQNLKFSKALPFAFTEHGAIQAANVLASSQAVEMGIYVVRAFVQLRQALTANADIAQRLAELEMKTESLEMSHDNFSRNTRERKPPSASSCAPTSREQVELLQMHKDGISVAEYWTELPPKAELEQKLHAILLEARERLARRGVLLGDSDEE